jgi:NAD(P)H-hydrate repair Nnr-like enzyme with NAD(P)H-hydrate dehydratase domain
MREHVIIVPHPEFGRLRHEIATATERFQQAAEEKQGLLVLFGTLQTITAEDRKEFQEQIEAEQEAYESIKDLQDKMLCLLHENPQAKAATTNRR